MNYVDLHWKKELLEKYNLPDIAYPVPKEEMDSLVSGKELGFDMMLLWLQEYCTMHSEKWLSFEPAMLRLAELLSTRDDMETVEVNTDDWFLFCGPVDLTLEVVTIHRNKDLIAAIRPSDDGFLILSAYHPLDARSLKMVYNIARRPHPDGGVCMRENNWEYALDVSAQSTGSLYAVEKEPNRAYMSYWEKGVGIDYSGAKTDFYSQRNLKPIPISHVVAQLGVYYQLSPDDPMLF